MKTDKLTIKAQEAIQAAQEIAHRHSHQEMDGEHLLLALLQQSESLIPPLFQKLGASADQVSAEIDTELARRVKVQGTSSSDLFLSSALKKSLDAAESEA